MGLPVPTAVDFAPMGDIRIVDITDVASFGLVPPCSDPGFDHRSCDYWEDDARGSHRHPRAHPETSGRGFGRGLIGAKVHLARRRQAPLAFLPAPPALEPGSRGRLSREGPP